VVAFAPRAGAPVPFTPPAAPGRTCEAHVPIPHPPVCPAILPDPRNVSGFQRDQACQNPQSRNPETSGVPSFNFQL
jgi:hypothetical protein